MARVLIVDDEAEMCVSLAELLESEGHEVSHTTDPAAVRSIVGRTQYELVLMDIKMPHASGIDVLSTLRAEGFTGHVIVISGYPSVENIVRAMKAGAANFYRKPIDVRSLLAEIGTLTAVVRRLGVQGGPAARIITENERMKSVVSAARTAAPTDVPVLLTGETGSGKEVVADAIVAESSRANGPFLKLNCAALPENLLESELFGHEAGAFTDAREKQKGKLELADGGTIFLDEIGDMTLATQAKLLRVLQEWRFQRLGGSQDVDVDVRVIAATNQDLTALMREGRFREDLYYRLAVVELSLPPLRERSGDILPLAEHFLRGFSGKYGRDISGFSPAVQRRFLTHPWPGNVRELRNITERAVIFCTGETVGLDHLPPGYQGTPDADGEDTEDGLRGAADALSKQMILDALKACNGVKQQAAERLRIHRKTLYNHMKKLGIE